MHPLEKRREMSGTFPGRIVLVEGDEVDVDLEIAPEKIRLATPFAEIGLWDRDAIHFERNTAGGYELSVADDVVTFYPTDVEAFAHAVDEMLGQGHEDPISEDPGVPPVSLVPSLPVVNHDPPDTDLAEFESETAGTPPDDDEPVSRFGPSSRERLAAAMNGFRERQTDEEHEPEEQPDVDLSDRRTSSPGFVIPGDDGYGRPEDDDHIEFTEDVGDSTVADEILESQRTLRGATSVKFDKKRLRQVGIAVVAIAVIAGLAFAVPIVLDFFGGSEDASPATVPQTTVPVTQAQSTTPATTEPSVVESTLAGQPLAFELSSDAFVERWNETAAGVSPNLRFRSSLPSGDFEVGFSQHIAMIGTSAPGAGMTSYTLEIDPTGPSSSDRLGIQALGLAIAVADPSLEPRERGSVLAEMGLNVRDPQLGGLDGTTTRNGVDYRLLFDSEDLVLRLTISPQA
jgi:hypothetical protein